MTTDPIVLAARFLTTQIEWMRHAMDGTEPYAVRAFAEIEACAGRMRGLVNGPSEQKHLGPCGAPYLCDGIAVGDQGQPYAECGAPTSHPAHELRTCDGDIYAPRGGSVGRCRTCKAEVATSEREAWLDGEVRTHAYRAYEIADAYRIRANTIRVWAHRGQLKSYWLTEGGIVAEWPPPDGVDAERLHYVGDVLDLAAADAARRETARAKRARQDAIRAAESEDAA